jgi:tRNA U34 2-thiouridine synthase MnmA/TrmU
MAKKRVVIGMSGGVDSSVSAWLLKEQGYEVIGLFMKNWEDDDDSEYCSTRQDWIDAASVADVVGVDIEAVNFAGEYKDRVFAEFLREYQAGRTPNPDVLCNAEIKFKAFLDHAMTLGADMIATGHYARVREVTSGPNAGKFELLKAVDASKDQSYFLHRLNQAQLSKTLFPLGEIKKRKDVATNTLYVVQGHDHPWLLSTSLSAGQMSWVAGSAPDAADVSAKTRYRQADVACTQHTESDRFSLAFPSPQWAVTPGQSAVLYQGDVCLGGGIIDHATAE